MGTWSIMPLLSTLAALVIIVHSLEESVEDHHDHHFSPRLLDTAPPNYDQWRIVEVEPIMQESAPIDWPETVSSKSPSRVRRPGRKRKRRLHSEEEDSIHEDIMKHEHDFKEPHQPYHESESQVVYETTELPRRRRKRPDMRNNPWEEKVQEVHRPTRRRGQRRRRPQNRENEDDLSVIDHRPVQSDEQTSEEHRWNNPDDERRYRLRPTEPKVHRIYFEDDNRPIRRHRIIPDDRIFDTHEEKSFSDSEEIQPRNMLDITATTTSTTEPSLPYKPMAMDALSLKELLKRSDGASLSEILQRRNLSLADLLSGREKALSALQNDYHKNDNQDNAKEKETDSVEKYRETESKEYNHATPTQEPVFTPMSEELASTKTDDHPTLEVKEKEHTLISSKEEIDENKPRISTRRRNPAGSRKRLRIKNSETNNEITPTVDNVSHNPRRTVKKMLTMPSEHVNILTSEINSTKNEIDETLTTTTSSTKVPDITENIDITSTTQTPIPTTTEEIIQNITYSTKSTTKSATITSSRDELLPVVNLEDLLTDKSESPVVHKRARISLPDLELRRQVLSNRLKKKRMKQKNTEQDLPSEEVKDLFGMANLVSASEFIAKIQSPDTPISSTSTTPMVHDSENHDQFISALQDVTMPDDTTEKDIKSTKSMLPSTERSTTKMTTPVTEEAAHEEIEEILSDSNTGARLSKILSERNMTVNELVEHRERGSSQVHLADIFHNTSIEPNPPEPFLSKSLIEPISKETYPLRALLEANQHDPAVKLQTPDPNGLQFGNIPIAMDFGNNVNENGENLGIVSLFNKINNSIDNTKNKIKKDAEGATYFTSVSPDSTSGDVREGRGVSNFQLIDLKDIFTNPGHLDKFKTTEESTTKEIQSTTTAIDEDLNREDLILLDNLNIKDFPNRIAVTSDEELEISDEDNAIEEALDSLPNNAKSVTIATAAIAGLTMLLFLLTYIGCKWKHQRNVVRNRETSEERIQTPVFESRKLSKINSSNRSISPMLSNSNIYTMSTLDSRNGKESPDYMWDSLRKPFQ